MEYYWEDGIKGSRLGFMKIIILLCENVLKSHLNLFLLHLLHHLSFLRHLSFSLPLRDGSPSTFYLPTLTITMILSSFHFDYFSKDPFLFSFWFPKNHLPFPASFSFCHLYYTYFPFLICHKLTLFDLSFIRKNQKLTSLTTLSQSSALKVWFAPNHHTCLLPTVAQPSPLLPRLIAMKLKKPFLFSHHHT